MGTTVDYNIIGDTLKRGGSSWTASQAHGLLCGRIAVLGADGVSDWLAQVLDTAAAGDPAVQDAASELHEVAVESYRQLEERQSEFEPLLAGESESTAAVAATLAEWCEGFLHGLVSGTSEQALKDRLAAEPISDIIRDLLEISRADAGEGVEGDEEALTELVEYLRVATQLVYEELSELRPGSPSTAPDTGAAIH